MVPLEQALLQLSLKLAQKQHFKAAESSSEAILEASVTVCPPFGQVLPQLSLKQAQGQHFEAAESSSEAILEAFVWSPLG